MRVHLKMSDDVTLPSKAESVTWDRGNLQRDSAGLKTLTWTRMTNNCAVGGSTSNYKDNVELFSTVSYEMNVYGNV